MRIAIFGGSFNPPHLGHFQAAAAAQKLLSADRLLVIPTAKSPHKPEAPNSPEPYERLALAQLAFSGLQGAEVSDLELQRGGTSFTVDTIESLHKACPTDELFLLIGSDMLHSFETWSRFERILQLATLAVFDRQAGEAEQRAIMCERLKTRYKAKIVVIDHVPTVISSTELRKMLAERRGEELLPDAVYAEIISYRYYGAKPDLEWLREMVIPYIDEKRVKHVLGCEKEAVLLAKRWGADPQLAAEAGILHDISKKNDRDGQLKLCANYGIMADNDEIKNTKLLHSKTGAALARELFGVNDEVYNAIFWHTTGRENMSLLEKILYMADYIEPNRDFDGVMELRRLAYEDLDKALALGLRMSLRDLAEHNAVPHQNSLKALSWLEQRVL